ncbi:MAG TPA: hypothetical protein VFU13_15255 [Steroidobacteraceae bacterium]|nr:hypothetical protein [Steroidobacteraceae bacterium]
MRGVIVPALLVFAAVVWWAGRNGGEPSVESPAANPVSPPATQSQWPAGSRAGDREDDATRSQTTDNGATEDSLGTYADGKYRFLFGDSDQSPEDAAKLRSALVAREKIAVAINTAKQSSDPAEKEAIPGYLAELAAFDQKIGTLLRPGDLATFEILKDSDVEQFQLEDYAGGVSAVAPLSDADRKSILYTKLVHRHRFRQVLAESRLMSGELTAGERQIAFTEVSRALKASRDNYLQEVRQYLYNEEQFILLSNYENSEYAAELEKLRGIANGE